MRTVTSASARSAACAQRSNCDGLGTLRHRVAFWTATRSSGALRCAGIARAPFALFAVFIGVDDALHERVAHDVLGAETRECNATGFFEHFVRINQTALLSSGEVDL